ncbi:MAG: efflux RND transporter permease subunit, partial [Alphaproteobacteria bacterium]|nr:efflux RND transporter permease subunit [Alphaproteobacteria bacterium]
TVPFALAAAVFALFLSGVSLNIYSQIGLVMLIGLMAKNGILMVEFADQLRHQGRNVREAAEEAAAIRLRPIAMTLISTVLGAVPLILAGGAGAEARQSIGWVIFGGLGLAGVFTLFLTPVIYLAVARFGKPRSVDLARLREEIDEVDEDMTMAPA